MGARYLREEKVLFKHCDPAGIVFFPRYFEMINDCVEHFFAEALDWPFEELLRTEGIPTAAISTRFRAPSRHGDRLELALEVTRVGRSSFCYKMDARCAGEARFEAEATIVHVDATGRPSPWPEAIRAKLEGTGP
jgi:4-hydroxybenzoyl-CoA thioesterase